MPRYDHTNSQCQVFSFKEGLLSAMAHDLRIAVGSYWIEVEGDSVRAEFDAASLVVETALKDGAPDDGLKDADKEKIRTQINKDVLHSGKHPTITFESTAFDGSSIAGNLTLHGTTKTIRAQVSNVGGQRVAEFTLNQPAFGVKPFKAALGALKVAPDVKVRVSIPVA